MLIYTLHLLSLFALALGRPHYYSSVSRAASYGFQQHSTSPLPPSVLRLYFGINEQDTLGLSSLLTAISDPTSPKYGQHLTKSALAQLVAPSPDRVRAVTDWLQQNGVTPDVSTSYSNIFGVDIPLEKANALLNATFTPYLHVATNTTVWRTLSYSVPPPVDEHLSFVYPTTQFIPPPLRHAATWQSVEGQSTQRGRLHHRRDVSPNCAGTITPACLTALYNISPPPVPTGNSSSTVAVSGFGNSVANKTDLDGFLAQQQPEIRTIGNFSVLPVDNGTNAGPGTVESSLDIQYAVGLAPRATTTFAVVGPDNQDGVAGFLDLANVLLAMDNPPMVLTMSFGFEEAAFEQIPDLANTLCNQYMQLGLRGTSVLVASGDGGVSGVQPDSSCTGPFRSTFPASCPYVTAVGSTTGIAPETAASFSSGGFSNLFPMPSWQMSAVSKYLTSAAGVPNEALYNKSGRAYPDISTQGVNFAIVSGGQNMSASGTSASSPTFAAIVALLNEQRLAAGKPPLGFLNPLLYAANAAAFNDITAGSNPGCGTQGFPAAAGWDPVTGVGTPNFPNLLAAALSFKSTSPVPNSTVVSTASTSATTTAILPPDQAPTPTTDASSSTGGGSATGGVPTPSIGGTPSVSPSDNPSPSPSVSMNPTSTPGIAPIPTTSAPTSDDERAPGVRGSRATHAPYTTQVPRPVRGQRGRRESDANLRPGGVLNFTEEVLPEATTELS
ncbi:peptidase S8/S53 domain-containing protein [Trametes elegans]|nr:peptidase S8/S53 domain-containing protein [Trametes elegans]